MMLVSTHYGRGYQSPMDEVLGPLHGVCHRMHVSKRLAAKAKAFNCKGLRDHVPIFFRVYVD